MLQKNCVVVLKFSRSFRSGPNQWRDCSTPKQMLADWCERESLPKPHYIGNTQVIVNQRTYTLSDFGKAFLMKNNFVDSCSQNRSFPKRACFYKFEICTSDLFNVNHKDID